MRFSSKIFPLFIATSFITACAGPMTPFGAVNLLSAKLGLMRSPSSEGELDRPKIEFQPSRQVLHEASSFAVIIEDPNGVPIDHGFSLTYNGINVTREFLAHAETIPLDPLRHRVKIIAKTLRVLPTRDNDIRAAYWRSRKDEPVAARFLPPECSAFEEGVIIADIPRFQPSRRMIRLINESASQKNINPFYLAGLIAQESSFDPMTLSRSRALGLTQITSLGDMELMKTYGDWPRYPGIDDMPLPLLKFAILNREINSSNEWRLNPALSIEGGAEYIAYLNDYWRRPDKRELIDRHLGGADTAVSELILASYNSGAARVFQALDRSGPRWLEDDELSGARKYVKRVVSYCHHFEHQEGAKK
jgi:hypothetical protein